MLLWMKSGMILVSSFGPDRIMFFVIFSNLDLDIAEIFWTGSSNSSSCTELLTSNHKGQVP